MKKILVLAVHPDDETLGCGGTLLKHKASGDIIYWLIATKIDRKGGYSQKAITEAGRNIKEASSIYGFNKVFNLSLPVKRTDTISLNTIIEKISSIFNETRPDTVYLPFMADVHSDHRVIFEAAYSCTKVFRYPFIKKILLMETISETEFSPAISSACFCPNHFVDITDFLDEKIKIMKLYNNELNSHPFPRNIDNIKALATFRGATAGCKYAESFMVLKQIC